MRKTDYEVRIIGDEWQSVTKAIETSTGWLHYELCDGTIGLTFNKPNGEQNWRIRREQPKS